MPQHTRHPPRFASYLWTCLGVLLLGTLAFLLYVWTELRVDRANELRYHSRSIVDELRQSSDDLTRMARTYVITGDVRYRLHYQEIIDIRDGLRARPRDYENVYWDLVTGSDQRPRARGDAIPLLDMMRRAEFTPAEMALLSEAKRRSDLLTGIERAAIAVRDSTVSEPLQLAAAVAALHDAAYHRAKADIMRPIAQVNASVDQRTLTGVQSAADQARLARVVFMLITLLLVVLLWRAKRSLDAALGCSVAQLRTGIERLGRGEFSEPLMVAPKAENSVWGWLAETQQSLARLDGERTAALERTQRVSRLYSALSLCNQAIVRCGTERELFEQLCQAVVTHGGMKMAWIGAIDQEAGSVTPVACAGNGTEYLQNLQLSLDAAVPQGRGPIGLAFRSGEPYWCQDFVNAPETANWHQTAARYGWAASAAIPLRCKGRIVAMFSPYSSTVHAFDDEVRALLLEMQRDMEFALENFEHRAARKHAEERMQYLAQFDPLTGLPNRAQLQEHAHHALALARRKHESVALMMLDLDHFKDINDSLGHSTGDELLCELARRLRASLREQDIVARLGGDEFIFMLESLRADEAAEVARKLLELIDQPVRVGPHDLKVTASIGVAMYPADGADLETLLQRADAAMYQVKQGGRHGLRFFTAAMQQRAARHLQLVNALRYALEREQMHVLYQPQISLKNRRIVGAEALLRWSTPELGVVSPAEFIPAAEESGLIQSIGTWVLRQAVRQARAWLDQGLPPIVMAVNLSAIQFRNGELPELISQILEEESLPPEYLELELTEAVAVHDPQGAISIMNKLHERGVRMSIDDFGTGFSSLSHLKKFKVYKLKIDQSFVRDISTDAEDRAIVSAIINMARSLGLQTIAEGVETAEQQAFLRGQHCDEMQGYYFSKPVSPAAFQQLVLESVARNI
ncbi:hypothetical protein RugamoR64_25180 [Duganella rhizosphaerae]|uniref:bifunctional diguanylate cyclase/phosphodiesterase n=1 Tax=Duganella rhizosphaerae TaxID=2885763 RepID=UPI0030E8A422